MSLPQRESDVLNDLDLDEVMEAFIQVLESAIAVRDAYTVCHQQRVARFACVIGEEVGLSQERLRALRMAGTIHDLGKIAIPTEILNKPGRLTDIEFALIKSHPLMGSDILKPLEFSGPVTQIILQHHERLDGSGYPYGLEGDDILLEARILGVADVVEAMCSHRPYRPSRGPERALEEIFRNRGIFYDAQVVDACLKLYEKGRRHSQPFLALNLNQRHQHFWAPNLSHNFKMTYDLWFGRPEIISSGEN